MKTPADVVVLGSGIAGLFFALRTAEKHSVCIVTKKTAAESATNWAQGGIAAAIGFLGAILNFWLWRNRKADSY